MGRAGFSARKNPEQLRFRAGDADRRVPDLDPLSERLKVVPTVASISSPHAALGLPSETSDGILRNLARPITSSRLGAISVRPRGVTDVSQLFEPPFQVLVPRVREAVLDRVIETGQLGVCIGCLSAKPGDTFSVVLCLLCPSFQDAFQKLDDAIRRQQAVLNVFDNDRIQGIGGEPLRLIEVKGRHADARDVIITKNEILASLNAPDAFHLALVAVSNGFAHQPVYVQRFFKRELGFAETAVVFNLNDLLSLSAKAA